MGSRWLNATIILFWMATMTWLFWNKVLPSLLQGEPPTYEAMLPAADGPNFVQVSWKIFWNERAVGTAVETVSRGKDGIVEVEHRIGLHNLPRSKLMPIVGLFQGEGEHFSMDVESQMTFDANRLLSFTSNVGSGNDKKLISVTGVVDGNRLKVDLRFPKGGISTEKTLPKALVGGQLSPDGLLKGLRLSQRWTVSVYTYFNFSEAMEILHAEVEGWRRIKWNGQKVMTWLVVYRTDPSAGLGKSNEIRKKLWVRPDGVILQQSTKLLGNWLKFVRRADSQPARINDEKQTK